MQTNCKTLSSLEMTFTLTKPWHIDTPSTGITNIFPTANEMIDPRGNDFHSFGTLRRARADPRHTRPKGTEAAPMNVAVSIRKFKGGKPSGAGWIWVPETVTKRALRVGMRAMGKAMTMAMEAGLNKDCRKVRN